MIGFMKGAAALFLGIMLLYMYPTILQFIGVQWVLENLVTTPDPLVKLLFEASPLIVLGLIIWAVYCIFNAKRPPWDIYK